MDKVNIVVYGTLKRGGRLYKHHLEGKPGVEFKKEVVLDRFKMYNLGWFPAIVPSDRKDDKIHGEQFEIPQELIESLDRAEGYPHLYNRMETEHGIVYYMNEKPAYGTLIENGNFNHLS